MKKNDKTYLNVKTEGAILPADLIQRISAGDSTVPGLRAVDYGLFEGEKINEAINRSWNRVSSAWEKFKSARESLPESDPGTTITRTFMQILFDELGYQKLPYQQKPYEIDEKPYPVSHMWKNSPVHLVGFRVDMDRRTPGVKGASSASPHSMVQEFLNRSAAHLWGFLSNGLRLRILRDNISLTRQAYVEFDIESIMDGEVYSDFVLLWLVCHSSRVEVESERPEQCWLEKWFQFSANEGVRALDGLRGGVEKAISALGAGFLSNSANRDLKENLRTGVLATQDYYRQLLRLVYRLIFLFVAEDRQLLLDTSAPEEAIERYTKYYSTGRIRKMAEKFRGTRHGDLYRGLTFVMNKLSSDEGCPELALPALGSFLWTEEAIADIARCDISNRAFLDAIRPLAYTIEGKVRRIIDYKNMGAEELGSVYESLLELHPEVNADAGTFELKTAGGNERKTTGSYYTPSSLINCLLDSALDPVIDEAITNYKIRITNTDEIRNSKFVIPNSAEQAILNLKICDPACGSGHFLISAAHRMAKKLATVRTGESEPSPEAVRHALRDVIGRCIYGVDINPMAVELCKVSLWMEALEPGKPLSFLEHHIKCGNSLIGATPALLRNGIPDEAFNPIEGDDKKYCSDYKKQNKKERESYGKDFDGQIEMFGRDGDFKLNLGDLANTLTRLEQIDDGSIEGIRQREKIYEDNVKSQNYIYNKLLADAWCSAFMWKKNRNTGFAYPITEEVFRGLERTPFSASLWLKNEIIRLSEQYQFFHWHLEFPDVFRPVNPVIDSEARQSATTGENEQTGWTGGFDVVLGNPPWERIKLQEKEWFATRVPDIASAPNASARKKAIASLKEHNPDVFREFKEDLRKAEGESSFIRSSGKYPLCGRGDVNTYTIFAELNRSLINSVGRVGCIVPSGIATDDTTKYFFQNLIETGTLQSFYDFENKNALFPGVHRSYKFCLLTMRGGENYESGIMNYELKDDTPSTFAFFLHDVEDLNDENRVFTLSAEEIALLNPNTKTCPIFRSRKDAELTKSIYRRVPVLIREYYDENGRVIKEENPWGIKFATMFHMANDSHLFRTKEQLETDGWKLEGNVFVKKGEKYLPLYESKMIWHFDHRFGSYDKVVQDSNSTHLPTPNIDQYTDPFYFSTPRYWLKNEDILECIKGKWEKKWLIGWRDFTNSTNIRTLVSSIINFCGCGDTFLLMFPKEENCNYLLSSCLNSYVADFATRQKVGGTHLKYHVFKQLPVLPPSKYKETFILKNINMSNWLLPRVLELTYTAWDLEPFAKDCGYGGPPFRWDEERRFLIRCELDAAYFHLYGINREDTAYIMETFPIVKRKDEAKYGEYRTKNTILEIYDKMKTAIETGTPYKTILTPPPADPSIAHDQKKKKNR